MPIVPFGRRQTRERRPGAAVWPPRRNSADARRVLAQAVAPPPPLDADGEPVDPTSVAGKAITWCTLRTRREGYKAMSAEAQRQMDALGAEIAAEMSEEAVLTVEVPLPSGEWQRVRPKREVYPKYRPLLDDDDLPIEGSRHTRADLFAALRADGHGSLIADNLDQRAYNALVAKLDNNGEGELTPELAKVIEAEPKWTVTGHKITPRKRSAPPTDEG